MGGERKFVLVLVASIFTQRATLSEHKVLLHQLEVLHRRADCRLALHIKLPPRHRVDGRCLANGTWEASDQRNE
jgi:hypothetical protein